MGDINEKGFRDGGMITWPEREQIVKEYLAGGTSKIALWRRYTGQNQEHGQILKWMRKLGYDQASRSFVRQPDVHTYVHNQEVLKAKKDTDPEELRRQIKELEKKLELAQLKVEGYELMIDLAEKNLKVPIRKKFDTK